MLLAGTKRMLVLGATRKSVINLEETDFLCRAGAVDGFGDGGGISCIVLAAFAAHAVRHHELRCHHAHGVAELGELAAPVVGTGTGFHADQTGRQVGDEFRQFCACNLGANQCGFACFIDTMHGENVLSEVNSSGWIAIICPLK